MDRRTDRRMGGIAISPVPGLWRRGRFGAAGDKKTQTEGKNNSLTNPFGGETKHTIGQEIVWSICMCHYRIMYLVIIMQWPFALYIKKMY